MQNGILNLIAVEHLGTELPALGNQIVGHRLGHAGQSVLHVEARQPDHRDHVAKVGELRAGGVDEDGKPVVEIAEGGTVLDRSTIALSGSEEEDGFLTALEVLRMEIPADLADLGVTAAALGPGRFAGRHHWPASATHARRALESFVDELSNWYLRRCRRRFFRRLHRTVVGPGGYTEHLVQQKLVGGLGELLLGEQALADAESPTLLHPVYIRSLEVQAAYEAETFAKQKNFIGMEKTLPPAEAEALIALGVDHIGSVILSASRWKDSAIRETVRFTRSAG